MGNIKGLERARLGRTCGKPNERRTRSTTGQGGGDNPGFVQIGIISAEIVRRLRE